MTNYPTEAIQQSESIIRSTGKFIRKKSNNHSVNLGIREILSLGLITIAFFFIPHFLFAQGASNSIGFIYWSIFGSFILLGGSVIFPVLYLIWRRRWIRITGFIVTVFLAVIGLEFSMMDMRELSTFGRILSVIGIVMSGILIFVPMKNRKNSQNDSTENQ